MRNTLRYYLIDLSHRFRHCGCCECSSREILSDLDEVRAVERFKLGTRRRIELVLLKTNLFVLGELSIKLGRDIARAKKYYERVLKYLPRVIENLYGLEASTG